jgi:MipA family protein
MFRIKLLVFSVVVMSSGTAMAQVSPGAPAKSDWQLSGGVAVIAAPRSIGSDKTRYLAVPTFDVRYQDWFFIDPIKGIGVQAKPAQGFTASAALGISLDSRRAKDDRRYQGLGDIKEAPALILGLEYELGDAFVSTSLKSRLGSSGRRGTTIDADLGYNILATRSALLGIGATAGAMDSTYARNFLGVSAAQSSASGLTEFNATSGIQRAGLFAQVVYRVSDDWTVFSRLEAAQLRGNAARSPIVESKRQTTFIVSALRAF